MAPNFRNLTSPLGKTFLLVLVGVVLIFVCSVEGKQDTHRIDCEAHDEKERIAKRHAGELNWRLFKRQSDDFDDQSSDDDLESRSGMDKNKGKDKDKGKGKDKGKDSTQSPKDKNDPHDKSTTKKPGSDKSTTKKPGSDKSTTKKPGSDKSTTKKAAKPGSQTTTTAASATTAAPATTAASGTTAASATTGTSTAAPHPKGGSTTPAPRGTHPPSVGDPGNSPNGPLKEQEQTALDHLIAGVTAWKKVLEKNRGIVYNKRDGGHFFHDLRSVVASLQPAYQPANLAAFYYKEN